MTKQRLLRSLILAIVCIATAIFIAFIYTALTDELRTLNNVSKSSDSNGVSEGKRQKKEIAVDVGIVTGIMFVDGSPLAVVDSVILREGQSIRNVKVVKINPDSVEFDYNGNRWSQKVNELSSTQGISTINSRVLPKYPSVEDIVKYVSPAVVTIVVYDDIGDELGFGSGFFIGNGKILTNAHVVEGAYSAEVHSLRKTYEDVTIIKRDDDVDLAVLEVNSVGEPIISLADDSDLRVGQQVLAIGNPLGLERTVSDGLISAMRDSAGFQKIQITAPVSHGSSGGPLLNMQGSVIGITYATYEEGQNLNFAIGIKTLKWFVKTTDNPEQLKKAGSYIPGKVTRYWIKNIVIGIVAFAIGIVALVYGVIFLIRILKRLFRLITTPFRRKNIQVETTPKEEPYQPVVLSNNKSERQWRSG
jgi:S1-C subfamily serine protease